MKRMISPQQFIELWGSEDLMSYDRSRVQALTIPAVSKRFLIQAGLPCLYPTQFPCPELPLLGETYGSDYTFPAECFPYRVLSVIIHKNTVTMEDSIFAFYCLDEQAVGRIMELYSGVSKEMRVYFRNSSIPQFAEFCLVFRQYDRWV